MRCVAVKLLGCEEAVVGVERRWLFFEIGRRFSASFVRKIQHSDG